MSFEQIYRGQVALLIETLPVLNELECFALKGGTAINLFFQNMPRLSIDIDLTYLSIEPRDQFIVNIEAELLKMQDLLRQYRLTVTESRNKSGMLVKLFVHQNNAMIKIEPNFTLRGSVFLTEKKDLCQKAQDTFFRYVQIKTLSHADIYGGKICAALDRRHPRDLFDIKLLMEQGELNTQVRQAFIIYLASTNRPMNELLTPQPMNDSFKNDFEVLFNKDFAGMTDLAVTHEELLPIQLQLASQLLNDFSEQERKFLLSIKAGEPDWSLMPISGINDLPGIQWKLQNINKMKKKKKLELLDKLKAVLKV
jgi:predicted nucleotidyltransferase component of viral defense system